MVRQRVFVDAKSVITTIPFVKNHEFNYARLLPQLARLLMYILYPHCHLYCNGRFQWRQYHRRLDGLATGVVPSLAFAWAYSPHVSGNIKFAEYLNIMYTYPTWAKLSIFIAAFVGACIGFLWYNSYPAQVFMGDTEAWHWVASSLPWPLSYAKNC